ncbi:hypothetical protein PF005_g11785 [Phytophthora fragariae]|uniref:Uncharacterized protein n=2 Tax=Phytophthora TaxID=4783 RepID=A0A6A3SIZ2_9STRA|nr:hypothetical protein PF003_g22275 [Phytophthora fragariae]KAE9019727.1 hypothetical protein PR002_g12718 [Phytophthora rubi]KAE8949740.1 hypothetical protein PF009_g714 [Phytophthora fragariae]KAE8964839.1 hypothetical protein PF011_g28520 [Phytophthora fragariae]KAE9040517.1 hypothetical protein PR001_g7019 [Phytophthora rubi]
MAGFCWLVAVIHSPELSTTSRRSSWVQSARGADRIGARCCRRVTRLGRQMAAPPRLKNRLTGTGAGVGFVVV